MLKGKKILLGVTGSIAAYKAANLVRLLVTGGAEVQVLMTPAAKDFVTPLTLGTLSKSPVLSEIFSESEWANHVHLGRWADAMLVAPLSCNTLAKMATGLCDNLLMAVYLSATCPVVVAPAMDEDMWQHETTNLNLQALEKAGTHVIPVEDGELASGLFGKGRMAEPEIIVEYLQKMFAAGMPLSGKRILISAGPTYEPLDPVRFIGNHSTGKMGMALARVALEMGAEVTLVCGPVQVEIPPVQHLVKVQTASEMMTACLEAFAGADIAIMCAAVADYRPEIKATEKIKKEGDEMIIKLVKNPDILQALGAQKRKGQLVAGFALETENEENNALKKLASKNADFIILNSLKDEGAGFGSDKNKITIFDTRGGKQSFGLKTKEAAARDIFNTILSYV
ncbi:MAG: bifunctional phosphopantothenoylcysteine decarboxylase/phosphopantothenate--cysteine ligase CoaBC [Ferruginibacter sp.]